MWFEDIGEDTSWTALWRDYIICPTCPGIRRKDEACPACNKAMPEVENPYHTVVMPDGREERYVTAVYAGAEGRYEDWMYLQMIEREWKRQPTEPEIVLSKGGASPRYSIALLFWSYFETRIERLLRAGLRNVPQRLVDDALDRYSSIGARLDRFYRVAFGTTYGADLAAVGHERVWPFLCRIQQQRNSFIHGNPAAIDDALVTEIVGELKSEHESWIAVFNLRAAHG